MNERDPHATGNPGRWRRFAAVLAGGLLAVGGGWLATGRGSLLSPDQQGFRLFKQAAYAEAALAFVDPMWKGVALFKAGEFEEAAGIFAGCDTAVAAYNQGNALLMRGQYTDAIRRYERALRLDPGWEDATINLEIARVRAELTRKEGGLGTGGKLEADGYVFGKEKAPSQTGEEQVESNDALSDSEMRTAWLRQVQTKPADFLRTKFAYQQAMKEHIPEEGDIP